MDGSGRPEDEGEAEEGGGVAVAAWKTWYMMRYTSNNVVLL